MHFTIQVVINNSGFMLLLKLLQFTSAFGNFFTSFSGKKQEYTSMEELVLCTKLTYTNA